MPALGALQNFMRTFDYDDPLFSFEPDVEAEGGEDLGGLSPGISEVERQRAIAKRDNMAQDMWRAYSHHD
jgi:hypothetical protein